RRAEPTVTTSLGGATVSGEDRLVGSAGQGHPRTFRSWAAHSSLAWRWAPDALSGPTHRGSPVRPSVPSHDDVPPNRYACSPSARNTLHVSSTSSCGGAVASASV